MALVSEIMTKNPACCTPQTTVHEVAKMMKSFDCGEIPVVESYGDKFIVGVLTDRDICLRVVAKGLDPKKATVEECMTKNPIVISEGQNLEYCCQLMEENQIRRVPVVDEAGECVGMLSLADVVHFAKKDATLELIKNVSRNSTTNPIFVS